MNAPVMTGLEQAHFQLQRDPNHIPKMATGRVKSMAVIVHTAALTVPASVLRLPIACIPMSRHHFVILWSSRLRTIADLVRILPDGGHCAIKAYLLVVIILARMLNLVEETSSREVEDAQLLQLDARCSFWLKQQPIPAELRKSAFLMVAKTRAGKIKYAGFKTANTLLKALESRCHRGARNKIECILDLVHLQKVRPEIRLQVAGVRRGDGPRPQFSFRRQTRNA